MHQIAFSGHHISASGAIQALYLKVLTRNFVANFHRENGSFTRKIANSRLEPPIFGGDIGVTYVIHF